MAAQTTSHHAHHSRPDRRDPDPAPTDAHRAVEQDVAGPVGGHDAGVGAQGAEPDCQRGAAADRLPRVGRADESVHGPSGQARVERPLGLVDASLRLGQPARLLARLLHDPRRPVSLHGLALDPQVRQKQFCRRDDHEARRFGLRW